VIFLWHQMGNQSTMIAPHWQILLSSIIILRVNLLLIFKAIAHFVILDFLERCLFVDYEAFNDRITSSDSFQTPYHSSRQDIVNRDGGCVVTLEDEDECDAAHLIPASKGDEVRFLINLRVSVMTSSSSTFIELSEIVLHSMSHCLQFQRSMPLRMECC
jgi:hypothetical protein